MASGIEPSLRIAFHATGRVQGVGFRQFTRSAARDLGLAGWVANRPDGSVTGEVEGPAAALDRFHAILSQGPAFGRVDTLAWSPAAAADPLPHPFEIHR